MKPKYKFDVSQPFKKIDKETMEGYLYIKKLN
jgi:hypothetical protein